MSKIRRVDFSPDEWLAGTSELEVDEKGVYITVCALIYSRGGPIPNDDAWIAKLCGCSARRYRPLRDRLFELGKLNLDEQGRITNRRALEEISRAENRVKDARNAAETSAKVRRERAETDRISKKNKGLGRARASAARQANHQPSTINSKNRESLTVTSMRAAPSATPPKKGTRLPVDWQPSEELRAWTRNNLAQAAGRVDPHEELEQFKDHFAKATGSKGLSLDWAASWRTWIRNAIKWSGENGKRPHRTTGQGAGARRGTANAVLADIARRGLEDAARPHNGKPELPIVGSASLAPDEEPT